MAAAILFWIRFLTWEGVAPNTAFDSMTAKQMFTNYLSKSFPGKFVMAVAAMIMIVGWSRKWWIAAIALAVAVVVDSTEHQVIYALVERFGGNVGNNVLTDPGIRRWCYIAGRNCVVWIAFGVACACGVRLRRYTARTDTESA